MAPQLTTTLTVTQDLGRQINDEILQNLKGKRIGIPDLFRLLPGWEVTTHSDVDHISLKVNDWVARWVDDEKRRKKFIRANFGTLAARFYPTVTTTKCIFAGQWLAWLFIWDDEIDCGSLTNDVEGMWKYCEQTRTLVESCRDPSTEDALREVELPTVVRAFEGLGRELTASLSADAADRIFKEVDDFVTATADAGYRREMVGLLHREDYLRERHANGAVGTCSYFLEYLHDLSLTSHIFEHEGIKTIIEETSFQLIISNDLVSLRRELNEGQADSLVPILVHHEGYTPQGAVDHALDMLRESYDRFVEAEEHLPMVAFDGKVAEDIGKLVQGCKDLCTGNLHYSYTSERYLDKTCFTEGRVVALTL
ncbi:MAG: hypothetical protein M1839_004582 [Geoglossum umbratile]|nr:MAG: hypothetical protein M1839_004582 [Geoglossum umbratile]